MIAFATFIVTTLVLVGGIAAFGLKPLTFVYDHWTGLVTASLLNSIFQVRAPKDSLASV